MTLIKPHDHYDADHLAEIKDSIAAHGWQGVPLVTYGKHLLTGTHRYLACKQLQWRERDIPTISIEQVFAEAGLDFAAVCREYEVDPRALQSPYPTDQRQALADYVAYIQPELPPLVTEKYGLDMD